jgi:pyrroloquinoline quinone biosynthesis protein B
LTVEAFEVPHRAEYSDTYGYLVRGPERALVFLPDIDKWERWERSIEELIAEVDVALLDATFYADGEIPGRSMAEIPHPFVVESLERFAALPESERSKVWFIHLNHTNPLGDPGGEARQVVRAAGSDVARQGQVFGL